MTPTPLKAGTVNDTVSIPLYDADDPNTQTPFDTSPYNAVTVLLQLTGSPGPATPVAGPVSIGSVNLPAGTITPSGKALAVAGPFREVHWRTIVTMFAQPGLYEAQANLTAADGTVSKAASVFITIERSLG